MNESKYANEGAFLSEDKLAETLRYWVPLSSSKSMKYGLDRFISSY